MKRLQVFPPVLRTRVPRESHFPSSRAQGGRSAADTRVWCRGPHGRTRKPGALQGGLRAPRGRAVGDAAGHTCSRRAHSRTLAHAPRTPAHSAGLVPAPTASRAGPSCRCGRWAAGERDGVAAGGPAGARGRVRAPHRRGGAAAPRWEGVMTRRPRSGDSAFKSRGSSLRAGGGSTGGKHTGSHIKEAKLSASKRKGNILSQAMLWQKRKWFGPWLPEPCRRGRAGAPAAA